MSNWTLGRRLAFGFAVILSFVVAVGAISVAALQRVVTEKDHVIDKTNDSLLLAERLRALASQKVTKVRAYLLTQDEAHLAAAAEIHQELLTTADRIGAVLETERGRALVRAIVRRTDEHQRALNELVALRRTDPDVDRIDAFFTSKVMPAFEAQAAAITSYIEHERHLMSAAQDAASQTAADAQRLTITIGIASVLLASALAWWLTRSLSRQISEAVQRVSSSSTELEAAATQQASAAREQAVATKEVGTAMKELLVSSKQIAENARRVAEIAADTAEASQRGAQTVEQAQVAIGAIKAQVDEIANHMLDLGRKSREIGSILEIINELADQTNILSINATIEAAGAGESGRRFAVVGREIRGLADRVGESTKRIRGLIEEVRQAVNTTVMATEAGAKQVDEGARRFGDVAASFRDIAEQVESTTDAATEIELSTKQQATAVEQVTESLEGVSQASAETEVGSKQTLQTASELTELSGHLSRLVQAPS